MNTITPRITGKVRKKNVNSVRHGRASYGKSISFGGAAQTASGTVKSLISEADREIMNVFSKHYGDIGERVGEKLAKLSQSSEILKKSARFSVEKGITSVSDKKIGRAIGENLLFPFINLPSYAGSWVLKKAEKIPALKESAGKLYKKAAFRIPRKLNDMDSRTDIIKGMYDKTKSTIEAFAKEKGISSEELIKKLNDKNAAETPLIKEANEYIKENLYKVSNKFFDKHTGNFNTAYERPLNRIITGLIPVAFLANDAYNLSVLCGDKKEDSKNEADQRARQEISRVFTTAFIQLITFGAFTKQVNTIPWFTPLTSAATVLFSEISSRKRLGKPVMFLSKEKAKEHNKKDAAKFAQSSKSDSVKPENKSPEIKQSENKNQSAEKFSSNIKTSSSAPSIFTSFKSSDNKVPRQEDKTSTQSSGETKSEKSDKKESKKALINFKTFKKGVGILIGAGFALSFLKNSSLTKNSELIRGIKNAGKYLKEKIYNPLAFKDFEMSVEKFDQVMGSLKESGCREIAQGHEFIKNKYGKVANGVIKMYKTSLSASKYSEIASQTVKAVESAGEKLSGSDCEKITSSVIKALKTGSSSIAERKYSSVADKACEIITNKKLPLSEQQFEALKKTVTESIQSEVKENAIQIETKAKPFVDIVTQPFKFLMSALKLPFKLTGTAVKLAVAPIEKKALQAESGKAELSSFEKGIHKAVIEIFGEKSEKSAKISQTVFANAMEQFERRTRPFLSAQSALKAAQKSGSPQAVENAQAAFDKAKKDLSVYVGNAVEKSFNGVTQSSNKNTDLAMMSKLASSAVTSAFLVSDNYNMVMLKSDGEDKEGAKEKANERIIQRLSALFYQTLFINWFNSTFRATYNSSLAGMAAVAIPNTITTEVVTRTSIGMPIGKKSVEELNAIDEKNENRKGFAGKYFEFMRLLTGKKPLKDRMPKEKQSEEKAKEVLSGSTKTENIEKSASGSNPSVSSTNLIDKYIK